VRAQVIDTVCSGSVHSIYSVDEHDDVTYTWSVDGGDIVSGNGTHSIIVDWKTAPGLYKVHVIERNIIGCPGTAQEAFVLVRGSDFKTSSPNKACLFDSVTIHASGGKWYQWSNGLTDSTITFKLVGDTTLNVIISDTACGLNSDTFPVTIKAITKPDVAIVSDAERFYKNQSLNLQYNGSKNDNVNWKIGDYTSNKHNINLQLNDTGEVIVQVVATNALGCSDSAYKRFEVIGDILFFPTAFSPNKDGLNDVFLPGGPDVSNYKLNIFNSWGQIVFSSNDSHNGWEGTFDGQPAMPGVYVYQCDIVSLSGKTYGFNGTVTLLK
jgi:gliding motility-associated-like protein